MYVLHVIFSLLRVLKILVEVVGFVTDISHVFVEKEIVCKSNSTFILDLDKPGTVAQP